MVDAFISVLGLLLWHSDLEQLFLNALFRVLSEILVLWSYDKRAYWWMSYITWCEHLRLPLSSGFSLEKHPEHLPCTFLCCKCCYFCQFFYKSSYSKSGRILLVSKGTSKLQKKTMIDSLPAFTLPFIEEYLWVHGSYTLRTLIPFCRYRNKYTQ